MRDPEARALAMLNKFIRNQPLGGCECARATSVILGWHFLSLGSSG